MGLDSGLLVAPANPQRTNCPNSELSSSQRGVSPLPPPTASHEVQCPTQVLSSSALLKCTQLRSTQALSPSALPNCTQLKSSLQVFPPLQALSTALNCKRSLQRSTASALCSAQLQALSSTALLNCPDSNTPDSRLSPTAQPHSTDSNTRLQTLSNGPAQLASRRSSTALYRVRGCSLFYLRPFTPGWLRPSHFRLASSFRG